jgi:hypothetical protein
MKLFFSAASVPGLKLLFWPALIVIVGGWIMICVGGGLLANASPNRGNVLFMASFSFLVICIVIQWLVNLWGAFMIFRTLSGSNRKSEIIRVIVIALFASTMLLAFGIAYAVIRNFFAQTWPGMSIMKILMIMEFYPVFIPQLVIILVMLNFRIAVAKEIEISKSGTSSTSSGSSSKSSKSSSSSSGADPVIEL